MIKSSSLLLAASITLLSVIGCSSKPTTADLMRSHATDAQTQVDLKKQLAKDWEKGTKLVSSGERKVSDGQKRIRNAERDLERARKQVETGNKEIAEGSKLVADSERVFKETFPTQNTNPNQL
ncbi:hypothetical protein [Alishewanella tabrizica]|uniref:Lipoprotein n=1 Tax=Alishewanella tabrizica TaxID=671278 RepID=A0ABQ2WEU2_9ALTE|nr:hypothetical protein [Alishewanella tabrizica]GGW52036.1 hypothetical protein GCM10008111_04970 [Alishewanella tabrizica]